MRALLFVAVAFSLACAPFERTRGIAAPPTLLIVNSGMRSLRVSNEYGHLLARVFAGERACIRLMRDSPQQLFFELPFKRVAGPEFNPYSHNGWKIELGHVLEQDVLSLMPAERCK